MPLSTFLNGRPPVQLRGLLWLVLSDHGQRGTATATSDSGGGASQAWAFGGTTPCRIDPIGDRGASRVVGGRIDERSTHIVTVPAGTDFVAADRWAITGRGTFEITAVRERTDEWSRLFEVVEIS